MYKDIDFSHFPKEREEKLKSIYRYAIFDTMLYRSNLWMHTHRVLWLLEDVLPFAQKYLDLDPEKARAIALVHDDAEMITGDVPVGHKIRMNKDELAVLVSNEAAAITELAAMYPQELHGYPYETLLLHSLHKDCIEAQLVSFIDKVDAFCEDFHELYAGNVSIIRSIMLYTDLFAHFAEKFPALKELLVQKDHPLIYLKDRIRPMQIESKRYTDHSKPYTKETLNFESDFPFYNRWRAVVIAKGGEEGLSWLLDQKEYLY